MKKRTPDAVRKLIEAIKERYKLKDSKIHECYERLNEVSEKMFEEKRNVFTIQSATRK